MFFHLIGMNGFYVCKGTERKISAVGWRCCHNLKIHVVVWQTTSKNCTKKRAARAARFFNPRLTNHIVKHPRTPEGSTVVFMTDFSHIKLSRL